MRYEHQKNKLGFITKHPANMTDEGRVTRRFHFMHLCNRTVEKVSIN